MYWRTQEILEEQGMERYEIQIMPCRDSPAVTI